MSKVLPLSKNHKEYEDVPDGLKWAVPIHECLEKPEVKARSKRLEEESKKRVELEFENNAEATHQRKVPSSNNFPLLSRLLNQER